LNTSSVIADEYIIQAILRQDTQGVGLMYDKYSAAIYGVILRVVGNAEIAEEVLQDVFTKAWRNIQSYDSAKGKLFTWLVNIARNAAIDATRAKGFNRSNQDIENVVHNIDALYNTSMNPDALGMKELTQKLIPEHQILIDLIYFQGYTQSEVSDSLGIPLGTVKTRLRVAMNHLRTFFK
jgi:RNA polymerase sigma factor (sigma-70 family)